MFNIERKSTILTIVTVDFLMLIYYLVKELKKLTICSILSIKSLTLLLKLHIKLRPNKNTKYKYLVYTCTIKVAENIRR